MQKTRLDDQRCDIQTSNTNKNDLHGHGMLFPFHCETLRRLIYFYIIKRSFFKYRVN
jgi:hypothetical protein